MIRKFNEFNESISKINKEDFSEEVRYSIADLIDRGFSVSVSVINYKTFDSMQISISSYYDDDKLFDDNEWFTWEQVEDDVEFFTAMLSNKYDIVGIELSFNGDPYQSLIINNFINGKFEVEDIGYDTEDIITIVKPFIVINLINDREN